MPSSKKFADVFKSKLSFDSAKSEKSPGSSTKKSLFDSGKKKSFDKNDESVTVSNKRIEQLESDLADKKDALAKKERLLEEFLKLTTNEFPSEDSQDTVLHVACKMNYTDELIIDYLLKSKSLASKVNSANEVPLHSAARNEQEGVSSNVARALLDAYPDSINCIDKDTLLPIHVACKSKVNNSSLVAVLLAQAPDLAIKQAKISIPYNSTDAKEGDEVITAVSSGEEPSGWFSYMWNTVYCNKSELSAEAAEDTNETDFTPIHLAVLYGGNSDTLFTLISKAPDSVMVRTSKGRSALDIAKAKVAGIEESDDNTEEVKSAFSAIDMITKSIMEKRARLKLKESTLMTTAALVSIGVHDPITEDDDQDAPAPDAVKFDAKKQWKKLAMLVQFLKSRQAQAEKEGGGVLGNASVLDKAPVVIPNDFKKPEPLEHISIDQKFPVGYRRIRWALLNSKSSFLKNLFEEVCSYTQVEMGPWNKFDDEIGLVELPENINEQDFIGAERKVQYMMPKSGLVGANMAYQTVQLTRYDDYCMIYKVTTKNPDVPYGKTFEAHTQVVVTNLGNGNTHIQCSVTAYFPNKPPMIAWKIKSGMYEGTTQFFSAKGEYINKNAV